MLMHAPPSADAAIRSAGAALALLLGVIAGQAHAQAKPDMTSIVIGTGKEGLQVLPSLVVAYEDNVYRTDSAVTPNIDDFILTPALNAAFRHTTDRLRIGVGGSFGYDFFAQQTGRNKPRIVASGDASLLVAGACTIAPSAYYRRERADYGDINIRVNNVQRYSDLDLTLACPRAAGLYPSVRYERTTTRNDPLFDYADQTTDSVVAGVGFRKPSFGDVLLYYRHDDTERSTLDLRNRGDQVGINFTRAISSLLQAEIDAQWLRVRSTNPFVRDYDGPGWKVALSSRAVPGALISISTGRRIVNDSLVASGYAIQSNVAASANVAISNLTSFNLRGDYRRRRFRQDPGVLRTNLSADKTLVAGAGLSRRLTEAASVRLDYTYLRRRTDTGIANYSANRVAVGIDIRF